MPEEVLSDEAGLGGKDDCQKYTEVYSRSDIWTERKGYL
jgi:hypothetical protein